MISRKSRTQTWVDQEAVAAGVLRQSDTTDDYRSIDIRYLKREGLLAPGLCRCIRWFRLGKQIAAIGLSPAPGRVVLRYRYKGDDGHWQDMSYPVEIATTPCRLGGERHWFLCPTPACRRRVAILYGGAVFACRHCHRLTYPSQREDYGDRAARRADRIRRRGSVRDGQAFSTPSGLKPKGMHQQTSTASSPSRRPQPDHPPHHRQR